MGREQSLKDIVNDNEKFKKNSSMTLTLKGYGVRQTKLKEDEVDGQADYLVAKFDSPNSKALYCDAVRYLTRGFLEEKINYAISHSNTTPAQLFGAVIYRKLKSIGVYS